MKNYEENLLMYIKENKIKAEQIFFDEDVKTSKQALINTNSSYVIKTIVFVDLDKEVKEGNGIIAIIPAKERVSKEKLKTITKSRVKIASPDQVLKLTNYPAGGVPPFGFKARFYLDKSLKNKNIVYAGGGSLKTLIKITIKEILKTNKTEFVNLIE